MPRKRTPKSCACGCGTETRGGDFRPGHDARTLSAIVDQAGGIKRLKMLVERCLGIPIKVSS